MENLKIEQVKKEIEPLTDDEKVAYLFEIIDRESLKPEQESDQELILYCMERADEYSHVFVPQKSEAEIDLELRLIKRRYEKAARSKKKNGFCARMPLRYKWVAGIAAVLLFFTISIPVVARAAGFANVVEFWEYAKAHLLPGDQMDQGDITFIYNGEAVQYDSVASFLKTEKLDIMYPRSLPDGVTIRKVTMVVDEKEEIQVIFTLSEGSGVVASVVVDSNHTVVEKDHPFFVTQNGLLFYIIHEDYAVHFAQEYQYTVSCEDEQLLKMIVEEIY
ncbi:MAG: hypothetical protein IJW40_05125 [Clostridia bacterium]|nr:hypothetical protein [Clostridia bacterium]